MVSEPLALSFDRIDMGSTEEVAWVLHREIDNLPVVLRLVYDGEPVSKSRARFTGKGSRYRAYTPEKTRAAEERIVALARAAGITGGPVDGKTYGVFAKFFCGTWHRRDVDNMLKLVQDALTGVVWKDDSQVSEISAAVQRGVDDPRTHVLIYETPSTRKPPTIPCQRCGTPVRQYRSVQYRYCSAECAADDRREGRTKTCEHCLVPYVANANDQRFCSRACAAGGKRSQVQCSECGVDFEMAQSTAAHRKTVQCSARCRRDYVVRRTEFCVNGHRWDEHGAVRINGRRYCRACRREQQKPRGAA